MVSGPVALSTLPSDFVELSIEEAVDVLLRTVMRHHGVYFDLRTRQEELIRWIEQEP